MTEPPENLRVEVDRWWRYSIEDLRLAEREHVRPDGSTRWVCVAAQQAAEKAIKSALVAVQVDFPRSHDLERLRRLLPEDCRVHAAAPDLAGISLWAVAGRYPADSPEATREDADQALAIARVVIEAVAQDVRRWGFVPPG